MSMFLAKSLIDEMDWAGVDKEKISIFRFRRDLKLIIVSDLITSCKKTKKRPPLKRPVNKLIKTHSHTLP